MKSGSLSPILEGWSTPPLYGKEEAPRRCPLEFVASYLCQYMLMCVILLRAILMPHIPKVGKHPTLKEGCGRLRSCTRICCLLESGERSAQQPSPLQIGGQRLRLALLAWIEQTLASTRTTTSSTRTPTTTSPSRTTVAPTAGAAAVLAPQLALAALTIRHRFQRHGARPTTQRWPTHFVFVISRTLLGCIDPLRREVGAPHQCPFGVGSKLPLPLYADVRAFQ